MVRGGGGCKCDDAMQTKCWCYIVLNKETDAINTFQMRVVGYWNKIPDSLKMVEDVNEFKCLLEDYKKME